MHLSNFESGNSDAHAVAPYETVSQATALKLCSWCIVILNSLPQISVSHIINSKHFVTYDMHIVIHKIKFASNYNY